ncbi:MAG: amylo-alpha-1,6-glucosidase [Clostridia bacterium]
MVKYAKDKQEKTELRKKIKEFKENVKETFEKEMFERGTIGTISEIYDSKKPNLPKGTMAQAWSVAEIFRIIYDF